ncbi:AAA family ATPase [Caldisericum sp.]|uniref:AAA family ATPase n=1 Tax=Caldisericum sp. TaxID=2499687 RepID=UPI003D0F15BC
MVDLELRRKKIIYNLITALLAASFTYYFTKLLPYYPQNWRWFFILLVGVIWAIKPTIGVLFTLVIYLLPITYNSTTLGILYLIIMLTTLSDPFGFFIIAASIIASVVVQLNFLLPVVPLLAAFSNSNRRVFIGGLSCFLIEVLYLLIGKNSVGVIKLGGQTKPLLTLHTAPVPSLLDFSWLKVATSKTIVDISLISKLFTPFFDRPILLAQILLWSLTAGAVGLLLFKSKTLRLNDRLIAIGVGFLILLTGHLLFPLLLIGSKISFDIFIFSILLSSLLVLLISPIFELLPKNLGAVAQDSEHFSESEFGNENKRIASVQREIPSDKWEELAGIDDIKEEIKEAIDSQFNPKIRQTLLKMSIKPTKGILLFGPPGTGKTKLARIIAHEAKASFFAVSGTEFTSKWYGESEANLRSIFEEASRNRPAVLFFDELEAFLPKRTEFSRSDAPEKGIVGTFLSYTDGLGDLDGVLLVGATNYPNLIDPAALRPGRFDKLIYISPPGLEARYQILKRYLKDKPLAKDVDLHKLAERMERFTGADIQSVCFEAIRKSIKNGAKQQLITMSDLETATEAIKPSITFKMLYEYQAIADQFGRLSKKAKPEEIVSKPLLSWDDVAGLENVKEALREMIEMPLSHPELFKEYNIKPGKGVLLFGPPGCGKTFLAKVVASEAKAHFLSVKGPELLGQVVGKSEEKLRDLFIRARENTPCILFFDEIDAIAGARGTEGESGTKILTQFLTELDGVEELKGVIVIAATNRPDMLDSALMRPGRFDRVLYIPPPDSQARSSLFRKELSGKPVASDVDYEKLSALTENYSSADIASICNTAAMEAAKDTLRSGKKQLITMKMLENLIMKTPKSLTKEQIEIYESLKDKLQR